MVGIVKMGMDMGMSMGMDTGFTRHIPSHTRFINICPVFDPYPPYIKFVPISLKFNLLFILGYFTGYFELYGI